MGASVDIVVRALAELEALSGAGFRASSLWRTSPVDCPPESGDFINAVALLVVDSTDSEALLEDLKAMERRYGRDAVPIRNAPRELDLDLLLFGDEECQSDRLTLPHPRASSRTIRHGAGGRGGARLDLAGNGSAYFGDLGLPRNRRAIGPHFGG